ncbi:MAG: acyltransferase domain-containing protein [Clostridia bacterium]
MDLLKFCNEIQLDDRQTKCVIENEFEKYDELKELLYINSDEFFNVFNKTYGNSAKKMLSIMTRLAFDKEKEFDLKGICHKIYIDTFYDIKIWADIYEQLYNEVGFNENSWMILLLNMQVFRLGRLQFQPYLLAEDIKINENVFSKGFKVYVVHIPKDVDLKISDIESSYAQAAAFFKEKSMYFICDSWLLTSVLRERFPNSHISMFAKRFTILKEDSHNNIADKFIFKNSSISRFNDELKKQGKCIGSALGYFYYTA